MVNFLSSKEDSRANQTISWRVVVATLITCLTSSVLYGYNIVIFNTPETIVKQWVNEAYYDLYDEWPTSSQLTFYWSLTVSLMSAGAILGSGISGIVADRMGRIPTILLNNFVIVLASALCLVTVHFDQLIGFMIGRFAIGITVGVGVVVGPMYIGEISPVSLRGSMMAIFSSATYFGKITSEVLGLTGVLGTSSLWPYILVPPIICSIISAIGIYLFPESPRYLLLKKHDEEKTVESLRLFRNDANEVSKDLAEMYEEMETLARDPPLTLTELWNKPSLRWSLGISVFGMVAQQFSGINYIYYYSTEIFEYAGASYTISSYLSIVLILLLGLFCVTGGYFIDKLGRRKIFLISCVGMCFSTIFVFAFGKLLEFYDNSVFSYPLILMVMLVSVFYGVGLATVPWLLMVELFSQNARGAAMSITVVAKWLSNMTTSFSTEILLESIGFYMFLIYAGLLIVFFMVMYFILPETNNRTIAEITNEFKLRDKLHPDDTPSKSYTNLKNDDGILS